MPKVSVIIPNYNHADYLKRRIDSVLKQTFHDFEVILLDDCSTDRSREILLSYKDHPKVAHVVLNEKNGGSPFKQWTKGFELATGDFIWIAESDDWCEFTLLENLVQPLEADKNMVLSFCQSLLVDETGKINYRTESKQYEEQLIGSEFVKKKMFGDTVIVNAGMVVFRKSALMQIDNKYLNMKSAGDWMFWVQLALSGNVFISCKALNYCYRHQGTVTSKAEISGQDIEEGNFVFKYVLENTSPFFSEIKDAIKQRINIYFDQKKNYVTIDIRKSALKNVLSVHPKATMIYRRMYCKKMIYAFFYIIKNIK